MARNAANPPQGALLHPDGGVAWRVWAPHSQEVALVVFEDGNATTLPMTPEGNGYFVHRAPQANEGLRYFYRLADGCEYPDPASRWQPEGVHRPSAVFSPSRFVWSDHAWRGIARDDLVFYEMHVGAFTPEGTFDAIVPRLPDLVSLGITAIELMPVAQFPGERNWGYDGTYPYAVQQSYGGPRALQRLVDAAHRAGLAVFLDVVYNHLGPEGNYLSAFGPYFTDRYRTPWGRAINFDGPDSEPVRRFFIDNARMWVRDFHFDGLRLDAVHAIFDLGPRHILAEIQSAVECEAAGLGRRIHVVAESDLNDVRLVRSRRVGGYGLDAMWNDDFHHAVHALLTGERDGYYRDFGFPAHLAKAFNKAYVYDGCYSPFRRRRHGTRAHAIDRTRFVAFIQNHDQVGNRARGERLDALVCPAARRLACGWLMFSPCLPLLFMGEEYGETKPFPFFCSFEDPAVIEAVRRGRREEFAALEFEWESEIPDPLAPDTFADAKLAWQWPEGSPQAGMRRLYQDLLAARRDWPALRDRRHTRAKVWKESNTKRPAVLTLVRGKEPGLVAVANLTNQGVSPAGIHIAGRKLLLTTEDARYGGNRPSLPSFGLPSGDARIGFGGEGGAMVELLPYELVIFDADTR